MADVEGGSGGLTSVAAESPFSSVVADPSDDTARLVFADWLDENGGEGRLWREMTYAFRKVSRTVPRKRPAVCSGWDKEIERVPVEFCPWFAVGCAVRCSLWVPKEFQEETLQDVRDLLTDLTIPAFSDEMKGRANAAHSRASAARSRESAANSRASAAYARADSDYARAYAAYARADAAYARAYAASSRAYAAYARAYADYARAYAAYARADAASSRAYAAYARADAASSRAYAAHARANAAYSRANAAYSRANAAERRWQSDWLSAVISGVS